MDFITLPRFDWFCSDPDKPYTFNIYSGSAGTDGHEGCIKNLTFSYKIKITKEDDQPPIINVSFKVVHPWPHPVNEGRVGSTTFECTPEGLVATKDWLNEEFLNMCRLAG